MAHSVPKLTGQIIFINNGPEWDTPILYPPHMVQIYNGFTRVEAVTSQHFGAEFGIDDKSKRFENVTDRGSGLKLHSANTYQW